MADKRRVMHIPAGALVLWESRTFHQNQYSKPNSEERLIQYVCYLPKKSRNKHYNYDKNKSHILKKQLLSPLLLVLLVDLKMNL